MKRFTVVYILSILVVICALCLTSCDNDKPSDERTVSFVTVSDGKQEEVFTAKVKVGETVNLSTYISLLQKSNGISIGHYNYTGPFWDEACFHKRDDLLQVTDDMTLYVKKCSESASVVDFVLDGETYTLIPDENQNLSVTDFVTTAYGKYADASDFKFYKDKEMTQEISFEGLVYTELNLSFWNRYTVYVKRISA